MPVVLAIVLSLVLAAEPSEQRPAAAAQSRAAWEALNAGRSRDAAKAFDEVLRQHPTDPVSLLGAGIAAHQLGDRDAARRYLVDALRHDQSLTAASLLLGDVLYSMGDIPAAISTYDAALALAPDHKVLQVRLEAWRKELALHDRFAQKLGDHFTVLFEGPAEAELARKAVDVLEAAYWRIGSTLNAYPSEVITVVLYTREQFRDVTQAPDWAGGAYDGRIRVPVRGALGSPREFERVLTHEFVHALVRTLAPRGVPQWLNEGLAMNFDGTDIPPLAARLGASESVPSLGELAGTFAGLDRAAAALAYAQSAVSVNRLLDEAGAAAIAGMLADVARGLAFADAFERHANIALAEFGRRN